jgi:hypothetical protein
MSIEEFNGTLKIPRYVASRLFLEIAAILLDTETPHGALLGNRIKTWVIPGREMRLPQAAWSPDFIVPAELCPILLLWPSPRDGQPQTNAKSQATLNVVIRLWVDTLDPLDCLDLYGVIEQGLSPDTVANGAALAHRLQAISHWQGIEIGQPAAVGYPANTGTVMLAEGSVSTRYRVPHF